MSQSHAEPVVESSGSRSTGGASGGTATYLYCLLRAAAPPPLAGVPRGLPAAAPPRAVAVAGQLWLVLAEVPLPAYGREAIEERLDDLDWVAERALAHEAVVEHFRDAAALLPMKLFTLFADERRAVAHVRRRRAEIETILERVAGCAEWGVRVHYEPDRAAAAAAPAAAPPVSGTDFLRRKQSRRDAAREAPEGCRRSAEEAYAALVALAAGARRLPVPEAGSRLLLDAAFLVPQAAQADFDAAVEAWAGRLRAAGCELALTGPWPPYNFAAEEG